MPDNDPKAHESKEQPAGSAATTASRGAVKPPDPPAAAESAPSSQKAAAAPVVRDQQPSWAATGNKPGHYKPWKAKTENEQQAAMKLMYGTDTTESPFKLIEAYDNQEDMEYETSATGEP